MPKTIKKPVVKKSSTKSKTPTKSEVKLTGKRAGTTTVYAKKFPIFEGKTVISVLDGGHTKTHNHCKMSDGTTMHVPKDLF
jgi:hypothetical protein